jgi:hypothetical protein
VGLPPEKEIRRVTFIALFCEKEDIMSGVRSYLQNALKEGCDPNTPRQCKKCLKVLPIGHFALNGNGYYEHECRECKRDRMNKGYHDEKDAGTDKYWEKRLSSIRQGASKRGVSCDITIQHLKDQYAKQKGLCFYTGEPMKVCSVDRVDSDRGYQPDNIVMCERYVNVFRGDIPVTDFLKLCHRISRAHPELRKGAVQVDEETMKSVRLIVQSEGVMLNEKQKVFFRDLFSGLAEHIVSGGQSNG